MSHLVLEVPLPGNESATARFFRVCYAGVRNWTCPTPDYLVRTAEQEGGSLLLHAVVNDDAVGAILAVRGVQGWKIVALGVLPSLRRQGVGRALLRACLERLAERRGSHVLTGPVTLGDEALAALLDGEGFRVTHQAHVRMRGALPDQEVPLALPEGYALRTFEAGDAAHWARIVNAAFGAVTDRFAAFDDQGFDAWFTDDPYCDPGRMAFACVDGRPVGTVTAWHGMEGGETVGIVHWLAVMPDQQGKQLGKVLLNWCLNRLRQDGWPEVWLTTEPYCTAAVTMYERVGLETVYRQIVYRKDLA